MMVAPVLILALAWLGSQAVAQGPSAATADGDEEYLLRGPLHEAFAEPVTFDPQPGLVVPKGPPEPVPEMPPAVKPDDDAVWISGYWAWDDQREDYIWVSGVYRVFPPGQRWVPGYWRQADNGYQWVPGLWTPVEAQQVEYLPPPPESLEQGPSSPAPSEDHFWINGCWEYENTGYLWRPGYWAAGHDGWVWVPAHYAWTPYGCIYVPGYWDYQLVNRGMCFAPVYFRRTVYIQPGYYYSPCRVIDLGLLYIHLFVRPGYCHYYFGDWYGSQPRFGIYASFNFHGHHGYDPIWSYDRWHFQRRGIDYENRVRGWHDYFNRHEDRRPPHTWHDQQRFVEKNRGYEHLKQVVLAEDVKQVLSKHDRHVHPIGDDVRREMRASATEVRDKLVEARRASEGKARPGGPPRDGTDVLKERLMLPETPDLRHAPRHTADRAPELKRQPSDRARMPNLDRGKPTVTPPGGRTPRAERPVTPPELKLPEGPKPGGRPPIDRGRTPNPDRGKPNESPPGGRTPRAERPVTPPELKLPEGPKPGERPPIDRGRTPNPDRGRPNESVPAEKAPRAERPVTPPELKLPEGPKPGERPPIDRGRTPNPDRGRPNESVPAEKAPRVERPVTPPELKLPEGPKPGERPPIDRGRTPNLDRGRPNESVPAEKAPRVERPAAPPELKLPEGPKPGERPPIDRGRTPNLDRGRPNVTVPAAKAPQVERPVTPPAKSPSAAPAPKVQIPQSPAARNRDVSRAPQPSVRLPQTRSSADVRAGSASRARPSYTRPPAVTRQTGDERTGRMEASSARSGRMANRPSDDRDRGGRDRDRAK
ncbi:MAG: hypothetical protein ACOX1P_06945 [Thermoguttaceae bacterium]